MSVFDQYVRLESTGLWQESTESEPREVLVQFGNSTLVLTGFDERALGHWALAGVQVQERTDAGIIYAMNPEATETLTINDRDMIEAIARVGRVSPEVPARPAPRRRSFAPLLALLFVAAGLAVFAPGILRDQAIRMIPPETAAELGDRLLLGIMETSGTLCVNSQAQRALNRLTAPLATPPPRIRVLSPSAVPVATLPGPTVLLGMQTLAGATGPRELSGWIALALQRDPVREIVSAIGWTGNLRYILTGEVSGDGLSQAADVLLRQPTSTEATAAMQALAAQGIDTNQFSEALKSLGITAAGIPPGDAVPPDFRIQDLAMAQTICK